MIRIFAAALFLAAGGALISGCTTPGAMTSGGPPVPYNAPYSEEDNPYCGALGNCTPLQTQPFPMHGTYGAY
jgi:hypothetical protein